MRDVANASSCGRAGSRRGHVDAAIYHNWRRELRGVSYAGYGQPVNGAFVAITRFVATQMRMDRSCRAETPLPACGERAGAGNLQSHTGEIYGAPAACCRNESVMNHAAGMEYLIIRLSDKRVRMVRA